MQFPSTLKIAIIISLTLVAGMNAHAQIPESLNYQGYLTDSSGQALLDPVVVEFAIYSVDSGGVPLWSEFQNVFPSQGLFTASFGSPGNPFPLNMFDTELYLGVKVSVDPEMTPRTALSAAAFSHKAKDANTVGGLSAAQLDQSAAVASLTSSLTTAQTNVVQLQSNVGTAQTNIAQLQSDLTTTQSDVTAVENTLPTLQTQVSQSCTAGSSIRQVFSNGTVTCETDDAGPWSFDGDIYALSGTRVGIGTSAPAASIQIDSPVDTDPFRARVASATKLRVHQNGSVSVGSSSAGTENGLYVGGFAGLGTTSPTTRLEVSDINWQSLTRNNGAGGGTWYMGASNDTWASGGGKLIFSPTSNSTNAAITIDSTKNVGISTTSPDTRLHVASGSDVSPAGGGYVTIGSSTGSHLAMDNNEIMARNNGVATILALNAEGGQVTINSGGTRENNSLRVVGKVDFDNGGNSGMRISATDSSPTNALLEPTLYEEGLLGWSTRPFWRVYSREFYAQSSLQYKTYSDRSLKKNVKPIGNALNIVNQLEGVSYELLDHPFDDNNRDYGAEDQFVQENQLGFIAQDLANVLPQLVTEEKASGLKTVAYMGVIPVLVEALKEQQLQFTAQFNQQQRQLDVQREEIEQLKKRLTNQEGSNQQ